jgi:hypothetical protein
MVPEAIAADRRRLIAAILAQAGGIGIAARLIAG